MFSYLLIDIWKDNLVGLQSDCVGHVLLLINEYVSTNRFFSHIDVFNNIIYTIHTPSLYNI